MLNLKSYYEVGNLLGKGNFAKVYEATRLGPTPTGGEGGELFALKTIEKKVISKNKRNFVRRILYSYYLI
jgi:serine/threonine protein kinase